MNSKEKAKQLFDKYLRTYPIGINPIVTISYTTNEAKQCALIAVDEILEHCYEVMKPFWLEVKKEIELL
jgi:DNA-directed RNA polymerase subunit L